MLKKAHEYFAFNSWHLQLQDDDTDIFPLCFPLVCSFRGQSPSHSHFRAIRNCGLKAGHPSELLGVLAKNAFPCSSDSGSLELS